MAEKTTKKKQSNYLFAPLLELKEFQERPFKQLSSGMKSRLAFSIACLVNPDDFDGAMIAAVNHSGSSAAVGAITGAILGAALGEDALPRFYIESLDCTNALCTLAEDMACGTPALGLFDDDWDQKYVQGIPPEGVI